MNGGSGGSGRCGNQLLLSSTDRGGGGKLLKLKAQLGPDEGKPKFVLKTPKVNIISLGSSEGP